MNTVKEAVDALAEGLTTVGLAAGVIAKKATRRSAKQDLHEVGLGMLTGEDISDRAREDANSFAHVLEALDFGRITKEQYEFILRAVQA